MPQSDLSVSEKTPQGIHISWFNKSQEEIELLTALCKEWQADDSFWSLEQVIAAFTEFGVKALYARQGNRMTGFLLFQVVPGFSELLYLYVPADFRRLGHGRKFIHHYEACLSRIPDCASIFLEVRESNMIAQELYGKLGFRRFGMRKNYYSNGENAINYRRDLRIGRGTNADG